MKFLIIQENGRHNISKHLRECNSMQRALLHNSVECDVWGLGHDNYNNIPNYEKYDIIINLENYDTGWMPDLKDVKKPLKFLWAIDSHCRGHNYYNDIFKKGKYHYILQATKKFLDSNSLWFPNCYDDDYLYPSNNEKKYLVGFCGNYVNRKPLLDFISSKINLKLDINVRGIDMINSIKSYKIHFNKNMDIDVNYRNFETMGCGTLLLTNYNHQYKELGFIHEKNCLIYNTPEEALEIIKTYTSDNSYKIQEIALNGNLLASSKHTFKNRAKSLISFINNL